MIAAFYGKHKVVKALLKHGAKVDRMNSIHTNALIMATTENRKKVVKLLLEAGADPSVEDEVSLNFSA
jgi:ankyrin repeat protein